jgi:tRNA A-37 threonylcarbamoyl transferase component Bud32
VAESSKKESLISSGKRHILYDASLIEHPRAELFDIDSAQQAADEHSLAQGRGHAVFFKHDGIDLVLKHYQRGGKMAALLGDRYIGLNCGKSRSFNEWRLLKHMRELNLPVPLPVAAYCTLHGFFYRAYLVTRQIHNVVTLADHLMHGECDKAGWQSIGACIRRFHDASIYHADLNARNILLNAGSGDVYLVDFDKGAIRQLGESWKAANLARLQRSLLKFKSLNKVFHFEQHDWNALLDGYKNDG